MHRQARKSAEGPSGSSWPNTDRPAQVSRNHRQRSAVTIHPGPSPKLNGKPRLNPGAQARVSPRQPHPIRCATHSPSRPPFWQTFSPSPFTPSITGFSGPMSGLALPPTRASRHPLISGQPQRRSLSHARKHCRAPAATAPRPASPIPPLDLNLPPTARWSGREATLVSTPRLNHTRASPSPLNRAPALQKPHQASRQRPRTPVARMLP